jgi:murein L,D-transpeptidase YcbB/YkuD
VNNKQNGIRVGFSTITHELVHKVTHVASYLIDFLKNDEIYSDAARKFLLKNNLTRKKLIKLFESVDNSGFSNSEAKVFEEINVYFISPAIFEKMTDKQIKRKIDLYRKKNKKEFERIWYGVALFKKEYENFKNKNIARNYFIWKLIEVFYGKVYFKNYKLVDTEKKLTN